MKIKTPCTVPFFVPANEAYDCFVTDELAGTGFYQYPNIFVQVGNPDAIAKPEGAVYRNTLFVHELCHAFRNYLNSDNDLLHVYDHGMTFKEQGNVVPLEDLLVEIEVLTLEKFILDKTSGDIYPDMNLYNAIAGLHWKLPKHQTFSNEELQAKIAENEFRWNTLGVGGLDKYFVEMICELKHDKAKTPDQVLSQ